MTLQEFSSKYKVKIKKDSCDDEIIPGRVKGAKRVEDNHHVFEHNGKFVVYFNFDSTGKWNNVRKALEARGAIPHMILRTEGFMGFDVSDEALTKLVLKLARIRTKRTLSEEERAKLRERLAKTKEV